MLQTIEVNLQTKFRVWWWSTQQRTKDKSKRIIETFVRLENKKLAVMFMLNPQSGLLEVGIARNRRPVTHFTYGSSIVIIPPAQRSCWGILVSLPPSVRHPSVRRPFVSPSVRPTSRVRSVALTVLVGSVSYLYILSSNFRRYVACKVSRKITKF